MALTYDCKEYRHIQELADEEAKKCDYYCASYVGRINEPCVFGLADYSGPSFVYEARRNDSRVYIEGLPCVIVVQGESVFSVQEIPMSIDILSQVKYRYAFSKGKRIFDSYVKRMHNDGPFKDKKERQYVRELVACCLYNLYEVLVPLRTMYEFLEMAERFNKKVKVEPVPETMDRCDGWEYYLTLE